MFSRTFRNNRIKIPRCINRTYSVRGEYDSPFDYLPKHRKKSFVNWKVTGIFIALGSYLSYSEILLDKYQEFTEAQANDEVLPIKLSYKLTQLPIYHSLLYPKDGQSWTKIETWDDLDHNVLDKQDFTSKNTGKNKRSSSSAVVSSDGTEKGSDSKSRSVVSKTLAKPGGFLIKPVIFHNPKTNEGVTIVHAGYKLCGYPFIIHGGILASILNESFKRNAAFCNSTSSSYKGDFKVENLTISYKYPSFANQFLIVKTKKIPLENESDKTIKLESVIESESGKTLVKANAILHDTGLITNSKSKSLKDYLRL